jgi:signal transduction histidine kinase
MLRGLVPLEALRCSPRIASLLELFASSWYSQQSLRSALVFAVDVTARRAFGQALMEAIGGEQRRIAQKMHDGLGQELTGLALSVRALANRAQKERDVISFDLDQLALLATSCIQDAHRIVQGLSPLTNADGNLDAARSSFSLNAAR